MDDVKLIEQAEQALSQIDREHGLDEHHAAVLAALRIRLYGESRKSLDEVMKAAGDLRGKVVLDDLEPPKPTTSLDDVFNKPQESKQWPGA
ncbi:MAG: hypothetical protein ABIS18_07135 [Actinomycetota bacterium]